ncbi:MAG: hypothetical protein JSV05_03345 [Candidatus Bathyarchaeota archaeon]|nr:MAG: hypothetical protein JSV05_03345 [Candidatus Bathyarchaeota archaeon]
MYKKITVFMLALLAIGNFIPAIAQAEDVSIQKTWVRMRGRITQWGASPAFGWICAHAKLVNVTDISREWAAARAIWTQHQPMVSTHPPTENFTISFFITKLIDTTLVELNYSGYDFYISGLWNVYNVTFAYYVDGSGNLLGFSMTLEALIIQGEGELCVLNDWHDFQLRIDGIDLLSGDVIMYAVGQWEIKICDVNGDGVGDGKVDIHDLVRVARRYGSMPGLGSYDIEMDFNFDFRIDIGDLTTLAANIEA